MAQTVGGWSFTSEAEVRFSDRLRGDCGVQSENGTDFLRVHRFIPVATVPHVAHIH
jgi:hypothetical protein